MARSDSIVEQLTEVDVEVDDLLFHYTRSGSLRLILENGTVRFSHLDGMNDPREKKQWWPQHLVIPEGDITAESMLAQDEVHREPNRLLREGARIACFSRERHQQESADPASLFHRGWARARMWEQYADSHTGACLVFDYNLAAESFFDSLPVEVGNVHAINDVIYVDRPLDIPLAGAYETLDDLRDAVDNLTNSGHALKDLFFTKNTDWQSEDEVRALVLQWSPAANLDPAPLYLPYGTALKAVVVGETFADDGWLDDALATRDLTEDSVFRATWENGAPQLRPYRERRTRLI